MSEEQGKKYDGGKAPVYFLFREFIEGVANVHGFGAKKYGDWNFTKGIQYTRLAAAVIRHVVAFLAGEDNDPESGLPHLDHAGAGLNMLKFMTTKRPEMDDRFKDGK